MKSKKDKFVSSALDIAQEFLRRKGVRIDPISTACDYKISSTGVGYNIASKLEREPITSKAIVYGQELLIWYDKNRTLGMRIYVTREKIAEIEIFTNEDGVVLDYPDIKNVDFGIQ